MGAGLSAGDPSAHRRRRALSFRRAATRVAARRPAVRRGASSVTLSPSGLARQVLLRPIHDWSGLFVQMGRQNVPPDGTLFPMLIEPTPAAAGIGPSAATTATLGFVQSIIRPTLLVIRGPLFVWTGATPSAATSAPAGPPARARALRRRRRQRDHRGGGRHWHECSPTSLDASHSDRASDVWNETRRGRYGTVTDCAGVSAPKPHGFTVSTDRL